MLSKKLNEKSFLLVDDSDDALEVIELFIESEFDNELLTATSGNEAIDLIKSESNLGIIICDYNMPNGNGEDVYKYIVENKIKTPFVLLCGEDKETVIKIDAFKKLAEKKVTVFISKPFKKGDIITAIHQNLEFAQSAEAISPLSQDQKPGEKDAAGVEQISGIQELTKSSGYNKISIDKFFKFNIESLSVFIKLSEEKYIKIIEEEDNEPKEIIEKYARKGVKYLYLKSEAYQRFLSSVNDKLSDILTKSNQKVEQVIEAQYQSIENIHESLANVGINPVAMELADKAVEATIKNLKKASNLSVLINQMINNQNYIYDLAMLNSYLSTAIAKETDWATDSSYQKLAMAALIQDISLENEEYAKIISMESTEFLDLNAEMQLSVKEHPYNSVTLMDEVESFSSDCRNIIMEHHELPESRGFPRGINQMKISPLSCIMIISNQYARKILLNGNSKESIESVKKEISEKFSKGNFRKPCAGFVKAMK